MTNITKKTLEDVIKNIQAECLLRGEVIKLEPTELIMVPYPDETANEFELRCIVAKKMVELIGRGK